MKLMFIKEMKGKSSVYIELLVLFLRKYSNPNGITVDGLKWLIGIADGVLRGYIILSNKVTLFLLFF